MLKRSLVGLIGAAALIQLSFASGAGKNEKDLQGAWKAVKLVVNGKEADDPKSESIRLLFDGKHFRVEKDGEAIVKGSYQTDTSKSPMHIDMKIETSMNEKDIGKTAAGIYRIKGNTLTWCTASPGEGNRPTEFDSKQGSKRLLVTLKKVKK